MRLIEGPDLIKNEDYPVEVHEVETEDGYILTLHRIPNGKNKNSGLSKPPVLIFHGLCFSSVSFLVHGPKKSVGFLLADEGYDVWLANARGNGVSYKHKTLDINIDNKKFYNFSFHEIGLYDIPASIDYILNATKMKKLHYIGYSQGATAFYVMGSMRPLYNDKIKLASLMAPPSNLNHTHGFLLPFISRNIYRLEKLANFLGIYHVHYVQEYKKFVIKYGHNLLINTLIVQPMHYLIYGHDLQLTSEEYLRLYYYEPNDCSVKQFFHYGQIINNNGQFRQYDYGEKENLKVYNKATPTKYDLTKISAPIALYHGEHDHIVPPKDIEFSLKLLPNVVKKMELKGYGHADFFHAKDVVNQFYNHLIKYMNLY